MLEDLQNQFEIKVRNNKSGEVLTYFEFDYTIEDAVMKAIRSCGRWNRTLIGIRQVGQC
jgi:hypothetical protein